jgi:hypothetical protein
MERYNGIYRINSKEAESLLERGLIAGPKFSEKIERTVLFSVNWARKRCDKKAVRIAKENGCDIICLTYARSGPYVATRKYDFYDVAGPIPISV